MGKKRKIMFVYALFANKVLQKIIKQLNVNNRRSTYKHRTIVCFIDKYSFTNNHQTTKREQ